MNRCPCRAGTQAKQGAADKLSEAFLPDVLASYKEQAQYSQRSRPHQGLSPHLHFGELSPNQAWYAAIDALHGRTLNTQI